MVYEDLDLTMSGTNAYLTTSITIPEPIWSYQVALHEFWQSGGTYYSLPDADKVGRMTSSCFVAYLSTFNQTNAGSTTAYIEINSAYTGGAWVSFLAIGEFTQWFLSPAQTGFGWCDARGSPSVPYPYRISQNMQVRIRHIASGSGSGVTTITGLNFGFADECDPATNPYYFLNAGTPDECWGRGLPVTAPPEFYGGATPIVIPTATMYNTQFSTPDLTGGVGHSWGQVVG